MATPIFSKEEITDIIRTYFNERKCILDKRINGTVCQQCYEDSLIVEELIGVFEIAK
jgi:hypothetical protein